MKKYIVLLALLLAGTFALHAQQVVTITPRRHHRGRSREEPIP